MARSFNVFLLTFLRIVGKPCVKSAKKKTFASSSEMHKEFLEQSWLEESFGLVEFIIEYLVFFFTKLILQICQRERIEKLTPFEKFTCSSLNLKTNKQTKNRLRVYS